MRWVGFDMDECLGSVMPLYDYVEVLMGYRHTISEYAKFMATIANAIYDSDRAGKTWLIRPAMIRAVQHLYHAYQQKQIYGAFVYSNNGSEHLVTFVAFLMNVCMKRLFELPTIPFVFQMAIWQTAPCRRPAGLVKQYSSIQSCLQSFGLPPCSSQEDLMFFDDMPHVLEREIPYYVRVPPYFHHTPAVAVARLFTPLMYMLSQSQWDALKRTAAANQTADMNRRDNRYILTSQPEADVMRDVRILDAAFQRFLNRSK